MAAKETVLYYSPEKNEKARRVKSVLVRQKIRIKNITLEQFSEQVGTLSGLVAFPGRWEGDAGIKELAGTDRNTGEETDAVKPAEVVDEMLVLCNFTNASMDRLFKDLRKSDAAVDLKAVLTQTNCAWTFQKLYDEVRKEHEAMKKERGKNKMSENQGGLKNGSE